MQILLALDVGLKRIGVAKAIGEVVVPLPPIFRKNREQAAQEVSSLIKESKAHCLIVGIPLKASTQKDLDSADSNLDDPILAMQRRIRHFISLLTLPPHLEVIFFDESFSSFEAMEKLEDKKARKKANSKDGSLDSLAAMVILERYLMRQKEN